MTLSKLSRNWTPDDEGQKREDKLMSANVKTQSVLLVSAEGGSGNRMVQRDLLGFLTFNF